MDYCPNLSMETIFVKTENSKTNEPHRFLLHLSQRLDWRGSNKHVVLQNLSTCCTWENMRKQYKNNKLKIIAPTWNDEFELHDGSCSVLDIQDYIKYIIKKHDTLSTNSSILIYINKINRLVFKIKGGYKLEFQTSETKKLFGSTKN